MTTLALESMNHCHVHTVLDLILIDRLRHLEDKDAFHQLILSAEVPVSPSAQVKAAAAQVQRLNGISEKKS
jgi:hypothetical protein